MSKKFADFKREKKLLDAGKTHAENECDEWKQKSGMLENQLESLKPNNTNLENRIKELEDELELCGSGDVRRISAEDERLLSQYKQRYSELRAKFSIGNAAVTAVIKGGSVKEFKKQGFRLNGALYAIDVVRLLPSDGVGSKRRAFPLSCFGGEK